MSFTKLSPDQLDTLRVLADGVIPPDESDAGASSVAAAERISQKIESGVNVPVYLNGLAGAERMSQGRFGISVASLNPSQVHELLYVLRADVPAFFKQLRMDVCALYLSDPRVWELIGFPGPSVEQGGYPDFDQPQIIRLDAAKNR